jgi:hypothetical protein
MADKPRPQTSFIRGLVLHTRAANGRRAITASVSLVPAIVLVIGLVASTGSRFGRSLEPSVGAFLAENALGPTIVHVTPLLSCPRRSLGAAFCTDEKLRRAAASELRPQQPNDQSANQGSEQQTEDRPEARRPCAVEIAAPIHCEPTTETCAEDGGAPDPDQREGDRQPARNQLLPTHKPSVAAGQMH